MATNSKEYDFREIEAHWQSFWEKNLTFKAIADPARPKYYLLDMFPYPSGAGLHLGHCDRALGQTAVGVSHGVEGVLPALVLQAGVVGPSVLDVPIAVAVAELLDPIDGGVGRGQEGGGAEHERKRRKLSQAAKWK